MDQRSANPSPSTAWHRREGIRSFLIALALLGGVLGLMFRQSLDPRMVLFSNDGPLGVNMSQATGHLGNLLGQWQDLNWLGGEVAGGFLSVTQLLLIALGPLLFAKVYAPACLLLLGLSAWYLFRRLGFNSLVSILGAVAAGLNMNVLSVSCWGLGTWALTRASILLAIALLVGCGGLRGWIRTVLAGLAVGLAVMEGFDVGAIQSLYVGVFVVFITWFRAHENPGKRISRTLLRLAIVVVFAGLVASKALSTLVGTQVKGVAGMKQDEATRQQRWAEVTIWSLPKIETLRLVIPGLFGYRIAELYGEPAESLEGSNYWGSVGQSQGSPRHSGSGEFAGVVVSFFALWAVFRSMSRKAGVYTDEERRMIWFWAGAGLISLLLAFGKHAPFYQMFYALPFMSAIRSPIKFVHPLQISLLILFGYGLQGIYRRYLTGSTPYDVSVFDRVRNWWRKAEAFDRKWILGCIWVLVLSLLVLLIYASKQDRVVAHLHSAGFPPEDFRDLARDIVRFSLGEVGLFILFVAVLGSVTTLILSGAFSGPRTRWAGIALGILIIADQGRADLPWIVYYDYRNKYATNPVIDQLLESAHDRRVTGELTPLSRFWLIQDQSQFYFARLYFEWLQHQFQFHRIPSLDINMMARPSETDLAYLSAFRPRSETNWFGCGRLWELTGTRYVIGSSGFLPYLNQQVDPARQRFKVRTAFRVVKKPGTDPSMPLEGTPPEFLTAVIDPNGPFSLFEFDAALPRARLYSHWTVNTNDSLVPAELASPQFDPSRTVILSEGPPGPSPGTNGPPGTATIIRHDPKKVDIETEARTPTVLLLNDHYHPDWRVYVDGRLAPLLRCNFLMRGVYLDAGAHKVEFRFEPPSTLFYVSLGAWVLGLVLCGYLAVTRSEDENSAAPASASPRPGTRRKAK